jgi:hypothetical protein
MRTCIFFAPGQEYSQYCYLFPLSFDFEVLTAKGSGPGYCSQYSNSLWAGRPGDQIPVRARFSAPIWTGPGAHSASYTRCTKSFSGIKWPGHSFNHPITSSAKVKEQVELFLYPLSVPLWQVIGCTWSLLLRFTAKRQYLCYRLKRIYPQVDPFGWTNK